jgi:hypothetical protein
MTAITFFLIGWSGHGLVINVAEILKSMKERK